MKALLNKRGEVSYIYLCVLTVMFSLLLSVLLLYMGLISQVQIQKREMQATLDGYVADYVTKAFDSIKQGSSYENYVDWNAFEAGAMNALGFSEGTEAYAHPSGNCTVLRPAATLLQENGIGISMTYTVRYPIRWNGKTFTDLEVPLTVSSYYKLKK